MNTNKAFFWLLLAIFSAVAFAASIQAAERSPLAALDCLECSNPGDVLAALEVLDRPAIAAAPAQPPANILAALAVLDAPVVKPPAVLPAGPPPVVPATCAPGQAGCRPGQPMAPVPVKPQAINQPQLIPRQTPRGVRWIYR